MGGMKKFELFRVGTHTAANGATISFSDEQLRAAVAAYDPELHEAPITVGHPKDNLPAYGWIKGIEFSDGVVTATPHQEDANFEQMVSAGRFKKRSASWYLPDSPNNPKPGTLYLRHVAFLGAQPPAVKGLKDVSFSDAEEGVVTFGEWEDRYAFRTLGGIGRRLREWIVVKFGVEEADKVLTADDIDNITRAADAPADPPEQAAPVFSEEDPMTIAELQAQVAALTKERDALKANQKPADFSERETSLTAREAAVAAAEAKIARAAVESRVDAAVAAGRLLPAQRKQAVDFACSLAAVGDTIDFGEGDKAEKLPQREAYLRQIEAAPKVVEFGEVSAPSGGEKAADDAKAISVKARALMDADASLNYSEAVTQAMATSN